MEIYVKCTLSGLVPMYDSDLDEKKKLKLGKDYLVKVTAPRNYLFHKKLFALYNVALENQEVYTNIDDLREDLTVAAGFYRERYNLNGEIILQAKSINFASMDEIEFNDLYSKTVDVVCKLIGTDKQELLDHISQNF